MSIQSLRFRRPIGVLACLVSLECVGQVACPEGEVVAHVREQLTIYGPRSLDREYFAFIYRDGDSLKSAVMQGSKCAGPSNCSINTREAAKAIPQGAKVLGEWHSHPVANGSNYLSPEDVWGAWRNRKIRCYSAYYAAADGSMYSWNPETTSTLEAMRSRVLLGNYREPSTNSTRFVAGN